MRLAAIAEAKENAERFLSTIAAFEQRLKDDPYFKDMYRICGFKETGSVRRASLDLTRSLSDMRKP